MSGWEAKRKGAGEGEEMLISVAVLLRLIMPHNDEAGERRRQVNGLCKLIWP